MAIPHFAPLERLKVAGRFAAIVALMAGTVFTAACSDDSTGLQEETYIDVMALLTWSRFRYADTPADDSVRAAVLDDYGLTGDELLDFAERHGGDVERMDRIWEAIRVRVEDLSDPPAAGDQAGTLDPSSGR